MKGKVSIALLILLTISGLAFYVFAQNQPDNFQRQKQKMVQGMVLDNPVYLPLESQIQYLAKRNSELETRIAVLERRIALLVTALALVGMYILIRITRWGWSHWAFRG